MTPLSTRFRFLPLQVAALFCSLLAMTHAGDWPQFRGPTGLGYTDERGLPLKWDGKTGENVRWKVALPKSDNPYSSPIVVGDKVVVTCVQNEPLTQHVLCFAKADGKPLWDTVVPPGPWFERSARRLRGAHAMRRS